MADSLAHQEYGRTRTEWLANLNTEYAPPTEFRRTSIICTIGMWKREEKARAQGSDLLIAI